MNGHDRRKQEKYEQILGTALELFIRAGISNVTITDIAEAARASRVTVFKYFTNKEVLICECVRQYFSNLSITIEDELKKTDQTYQERLLGLMAAKNESFHAFQGELFPWLKKQSGTFLNEIMELRRISIKNLVIPFLKEGRDCGLIYSDISDDLILTYLDILGLGLMFSPLYTELEYKSQSALEEIQIIAVRAVIKTKLFD